MKLNGITIMSCEMVREQWCRPDFQLKEIWKNIANGTFESFEQDVVKQNSGIMANKMTQAHKVLATEILRCIQCLREGDGAEDFLRDGKLDHNALHQKLQEYSRNVNSLGKDQHDFFSRNAEDLELLYGIYQEAWNERQVYTLYLFLLLQLQIMPKDKIRQQDITFLTELLRKQAPARIEHRNACRLCLTEDIVLRCSGKEVLRYDLRKHSGWTNFYQSREPIAGIAFTESLGLIAFTDSGRLCSCTPAKIRSAAAEKNIVMASAYGRQYVLLTEDGGVISNLPVAENPAWKNLSWVSAGLNSAAGISGKKDNAVAYGLEWFEDYTDVKTVVTHCAEGKNRFAILKHDGTLVFDQGGDAENVSAVCMGKQGYIYIKDRDVFFRPFAGGVDRRAAILPEGVDPAELHSAGNYFLCGTVQKPYLGVLFRDS